MSLSASDWELLHRAVDGEATEAESAELETRLAREPDLAASHRALQGVGRTLSEVGLVESPPELAGDVMRQVRQRPHSVAEQRGLSGLTGWVARQPGLALAASLAVGLLAGLLATGLSGRGALMSLDENTVSGTILPFGHLATLPVIDEIEIGGPGTGATVVTRRGSDVVVAEVRIRSPRPLDLTVELDSGTLRPRGFVSLEDLPTGEVALEEGLVRVRQAPEGHYLLTLAVLGPDPAPLRIRLESGDAALEGELRAVAPQ
jgi:anti-sigma factor RsiW